MSAKCNFGFHKWKNCSVGFFSHITLLFVVVKKSIKEKLSFSLGGEGVFVQPAKICFITPGSRELFGVRHDGLKQSEPRPQPEGMALECRAESGPTH